jgi:hypothetical protein
VAGDHCGLFRRGEIAAAIVIRGQPTNQALLARQSQHFLRFLWQEKSSFLAITGSNCRNVSESLMKKGWPGLEGFAETPVFFSFTRLPCVLYFLNTDVKIDFAACSSCDFEI